MTTQFMNMLANLAPRTNRTIDDLRTSNDQLAGHDGMELRGWAGQTSLSTQRDMSDALGTALQSGLSTLQTYVLARVDKAGDREVVVKELYDARWGPTRVPIYTAILKCHAAPESNQELLALTQYLAHDLNVPVDGTDVLGASGLYWAISTKPHVKPEVAQLLFDASGNVNQRNRFNGTVGSEIAQADFAGDTQRNVQMMKWYVEHGGDVDGKDNDGMNVKMLVEMMKKRVPGMSEVVAKGRGERGEADCVNCGRLPSGERKFAACKRCKGVRYCSVECQKVDWRGHRKRCIPC